MVKRPILHLAKRKQNVRILLHFQKRWQAWDISTGSVKMHFPWQAQYKRHVQSAEMLGGQSADFLRGVSLWIIRFFRFAKMIVRDRCTTSYDVASLFPGRRSTLDR